MTALQRAAQRIAEWRRDIVAFVRENFQTEPDRWQRQALLAFANDHDPQCQRIALQACAGPGKSAVEAWCGWHFLATRGDVGHHPNGYALSVTGDNLRDNLWKELAVWRGRSPFLQAAFEWTAEKIFAKDHPATWWLKARTWPKTADAEAQGRTLSGLHSRYILYLIDESGDIAPPILRAAEQGLGNCEWGKIVQAGNPTSHEGMLYLAVTAQSDKWTVIRITGDPDDPNRSSRISMEWAREQIALYGRDNPWVMAYILGQFPPSSINALLGPDEVRAAMQRHVHEDAHNWAQKRLGIDCARFGDDRTVLFPRQGLVAYMPVTLRNASGTRIAERVMVAKQRWGQEVELLDDTGGWGQSTIDTLRAAGYSPIGVQFHAPALDPRYANRRAEMWWLMAEWVKRGGVLPNLPELVGELTTTTYTFKGGKLLMEDKDLVKKRLGRSPDLADALALTFALPEMPAQVESLTGVPMLLTAGGTMAAEFDPLDDSRWSA